MDDGELRQDFLKSLELYEGVTAKDCWLTACAAFLGLRHRVVAKWECELHQERSPDQGYALCYSLRNLSISNQTHLLERERAEDWDEVMEMSDHLSEWYASEIREFCILAHRVHSTFAPSRNRLTPRQREQPFRCFWYFDAGEDLR
jgi:hypothetical protein